MRYFVIGPQGERYGPADVQLLKQWAAEGRVLPNMTLIEESGRPVPAMSVPGLFDRPAPSSSLGAMPDPMAAPTASQPYPGSSSPFDASGPSPVPTSPYYRPDAYGKGDDGSKDITSSFIFSALGIICCPVIFSVLGIVFANRAKQKGHPTSQAALIVAIVSLALGAGFFALAGVADFLNF